MQMQSVTGNLLPLGDKLIVKLSEVKTVTDSGLALPASAQTRPVTGIVMLAGSGRITEKGVKIPTEIRIGEKVLFATHAGTSLEINSEPHLIISESEIIGMISD